MSLKPSIVVFLLLLMAPLAGAKELSFTLLGINGDIHRLSDYQGRWVVMNLWATWCPPCLEEIPELQAFHDKHQEKDIVVLGVNMEDIALEGLREFVDEHFISYPILRGGPAGADPLSPMTALPMTYFISPSGELATTHIGPLTSAEIEGFIRQQQPTRPPVWKLWQRH